MAITAPISLTTELIVGGVRLSWSGTSDNEQGYEIYVSTNSGMTYTLTGTTQNNIETYDYMVDDPGAILYFKVRAVGGTNFSYFKPSEETFIITLANPYTDVIKITANSNSEFHLKINNQILYSESELKTLLDNMPKVDPDEDRMSMLFRWVISNRGIASGSLSVLTNSEFYDSPILALNSYWNMSCGVSWQLWNILKLYYDNNAHIYGSGHSGHMWNNTPDGFIDGLKFLQFYKGRYEHFTGSELDVYDWTEPIKELPSDQDNYLESDFDIASEWQFPNTTEESRVHGVGTLTMKLPQDATIILPVKTANIPTQYIADEGPEYQGNNLLDVSQAVVSVGTGVIGDVDMPFILLQITGTGTTVVDEITYTLPADESALKTILQQYAKFYHNFEILTNTGGIEAEYLLNARRLQLLPINFITKGIISGDITVESTTTPIPCPTYPLTITNLTNDLKWSITQDYIFDGISSIRRPVDIATNPNYFDSWLTFFSKTYEKRPQMSYLFTSIPNQPTGFDATTKVYDQCFAPIIRPKVDTFIDAEEITLSCFDTGATIYYTLDGTTPDATKTVYTAPFTITGTTTIKCITIKTDFENSRVQTRTIVCYCAPSNLTITVVPGGIKLDWEDNCSDEDGYEIWASINNSPFSVIDTVAANVTTYTDTTLRAGSEIVYKVRSFKGIDYSDYLTSDLVEFPALILSDTHTVAYYNFYSGITKDENDRVSAWDDKLDPKAATKLGNVYGEGTYPLWTNEGVKFVASRNDLLQKAFTLSQPTHIYIVFRIDTFVNNTGIMDGYNLYGGALVMGNLSNRVTLRTGDIISSPFDGIVSGLNIVRIKFNGSNSFIQVNDGGYQAVSLESGAMGGISLGILGNTGGPSNVTIQDVVVRNVLDGTSDDDDIYNYLKYINEL